MNPGWQTVFQKGLNHLLEQHGWATQKLAPHYGKRLGLRLGTLTPLVLEIRADGGFLQVKSDGTDAPCYDVEVYLPQASLPRLMGNPKALFSAVEISGPAGLAEDIGFVFKHLHWEIEDDLSGWVGEIAAQRLGAGLRKLGGSISSTTGRLHANLNEFLANEAGLPRQGELTELGRSLERLVKDTDHLAARIERLG